MASSPHTPKQIADMQAERTAKLAAVPTHVAIGQNTVAAWLNDRARELKLVNDREQASAPLT